jgi:hypothetical protein
VGVWYCTREDVARALDSKLSARNTNQIDRAVEAGARAVEGLTHRRFYPWTGTRYVDWPDFSYSRPWRLWLGPNELISLTTLVSGGTTIAASDYFLRRSDGLDEPPYTMIEIDLSSSSGFSVGTTSQRSAVLTGVFGACNDTAPAGALAEALDDSETGVDVTDSSLIGVGSVLLVDSERMIVTGRSMVDTTVNIDAADSLTASMADVSITVSTTTGAPTVDEVILIDSERMLVVDVAGTVLTVRRAWDGSVLATHAANADIYAPRTLTVTRGALGTTAASHLNAAAIQVQTFPGLVRDLNIAEAMNTLIQESSAYAREIGSGENTREASGRGLKSLREDVYTSHGRKIRMAAI